MSNQVQTSLEFLHPILQDSCRKIQINVIGKHAMPFKLFETGRSHERQQHLISKGRTQTVFTKHLYSNLNTETPLYAVAMDFVFHINSKWSWNLRDQTIMSWYLLFGNLALDNCPELEWGGNSRKSVNYTHFQLREEIVLENIKKYPCVLHI